MACWWRMRRRFWGVGCSVVGGVCFAVVLELAVLEATDSWELGGRRVVRAVW